MLREEKVSKQVGGYLFINLTEYMDSCIYKVYIINELVKSQVLKDFFCVYFKQLGNLVFFIGEKRILRKRFEID